MADLYERTIQGISGAISVSVDADGDIEVVEESSYDVAFLTADGAQKLVEALTDAIACAREAQKRDRG